MTDRPSLRCPECNEDAVPAHGRGRYDEDGNYVEHRDGCRCPWCQWMWFGDSEPVTCACGSVLRIEVDDETAYAVADAPAGDGESE